MKKHIRLILLFLIIAMLLNSLSGCSLFNSGEEEAEFVIPYLALTEEKQKETQVAFPNNPILCSTKNKPMCSFLIVVGSHLLFNEICVTHETTHEILDCAKIMD